jgi:hypothetical protein
MAKSFAVRRSVTFTLRQGRWASRKMNRLTVPLRRFDLMVDRADYTSWLGREDSNQSMHFIMHRF